MMSMPSSYYNEWNEIFDFCSAPFIIPHKHAPILRFCFLAIAVKTWCVFVWRLLPLWCCMGWQVVQRNWKEMKRNRIWLETKNKLEEEEEKEGSLWFGWLTSSWNPKFQLFHWLWVWVRVLVVGQWTYSPGPFHRWRTEPLCRAWPPGGIGMMPIDLLSNKTNN